MEIHEHCAAWSLGKLEMSNSITRMMFTSAMGFAWDIIKAGERVVAYAEDWEVTEANAERAGFVERAVWRSGGAILRVGERLELAVNACAMRLGYADGEISSYVFDQLMRASSASCAVVRPV
jgi:hypothetical protein